MSTPSEVETFWRFIVSSVEQLLGCLDGLSAEELNWRPLENANSLYVLATHTMGNMEENILGILCGYPGQRQREAEFAAGGDSPHLLRQKWDDLQARIKLALDQLSAAELDQLHKHPRRGQITGRAILIVVARHAAEHMGQADLTRDLILSARGRKPS